MTELQLKVQAIVVKKLTQLGHEVPFIPETDPKEPDLEMEIEEVEQAILNYCNITVVPTDLRYVWANMIVDYLTWVDAQNETNTSSGGSGEVSSTPVYLSSIKEGSTTIGFSADTNGQTSNALNAHTIKGALDAVVMNYKDALNKFRKVAW